MTSIPYIFLFASTALSFGDPGNSFGDNQNCRFFSSHYPILSVTYRVVHAQTIWHTIIPVVDNLQRLRPVQPDPALYGSGWTTHDGVKWCLL